MSCKGSKWAKKNPASKFISIPVKARKISDKIVYEADDIATDEHRRVFRQMQTRQVKVNLSLSWDGVKQPLKRKSEGHDAKKLSETESLGQKDTVGWLKRLKDQVSNDDPEPSPVQSLNISSNLPERKLIMLPIKRAASVAPPADSTQSILNEKSLKKTFLNEPAKAVHGRLVETELKSSELLSDSKRAKVALVEDDDSDDDIVEVTLDSVNSTSLDDIIAIEADDDDDHEDVKVVYEKKGEVGCAFCHLSFPDYRQLMQHSVRFHRQDATKSFSSTPGLQCAYCTKGFFDSINLMKHVAAAHLQPGKEMAKSKIDDSGKEPTGNPKPLATTTVDTNGNEVKLAPALTSKFVQPEITAKTHLKERNAAVAPKVPSTLKQPSRVRVEPFNVSGGGNDDDDLFQCSRCSYQCSSVDDLLRHNGDSHSRKREQRKVGVVYLCPYCPFIARFRYKVRWQQHFDEAHPDALKKNKVSGKYECLVCSKSDTNKIALNHHILEAHAETTITDGPQAASSSGSESPGHSAAHSIVSINDLL